MQRLRIRYAKRGRLRFTSHRDFSRAFERAVFRARVPMAYSSRLQPAPAHLVRRRGADRLGQRGGVPRDRPGRGRRPGRGPRRARRGAARRPRRARGRGVARAARWPTCSRAAAGGSTLAADPRQAAGAAVDDASSRTDEVAGGADDQEGLREFDCRGAVVARAARPTRRRRRPALDVVLRHTVPGRAARRRARRPDGGGRPRPGEAPLLTRLAQGPLDEATGEIGDPLARRHRRPPPEPVCDTRRGRRRLDPSGSVDPTTFSPARDVVRHGGCDRRQTATRPGGVGDSDASVPDGPGDRGR